MFGNTSALGAHAFEGGFIYPPRDWSGAPASGNPYPSALAGAGSLVAPYGGTIQGRFGWATVAGQVFNTRQAASDRLGVVIPKPRANVGGAGWTWQFFDRSVGAFRIREGLPVVLITAGAFWLKFASGAYAGDAVYASLVDGSAISGETSNAELTGFRVACNCAPGGLASVTSFNTYGA